MDEMRAERDETPAFFSGKSVESQQGLVFIHRFSVSIQGQRGHPTPPSGDPGLQENRNIFFS
jgi:hypothetical protein